MVFSREDIQKLANLAKLRLTPEEEEKFVSQLSSILEYVEKIKAVDTSKVETRYHVSDVSNVRAEDVAQQDDATEIVNVAPRKTGKFIETLSIRND